MSYEYCIAGTTRFTQQGYITPTSSAIRIYEVFVVASGSNQSIYFTDNAPTTTATSTTTEKLRVPVTDSTTGYFVGQYSNSVGIRFNSSALLHTCSSISYVVVNFTTEK